MERSEPEVVSEEQVDESVEVRRRLKNVIFDLNRLNYANHVTRLSSTQSLKDFQDYCKQFKAYVDFKDNNPYSEKDYLFEGEPTPRMARNGKSKIS